MTYTVIELFAGAGGLALGLENAGLEASLLVDNEKDCIDTLKSNNPNWNAIQADVTGFDFRGLSADVVTGGFPCQAFSHAGKRLGFEDTRGTLFFEFARCVKEVQPKVFVGENVDGLIRHDGGNTLKVMVDVLGSFGYKVKCKVLNAVDYGVPQKRKRLFVVGVRDGYYFKFPEPEKRTVTLGDALAGVPESSGTGYSESRKAVLDLVPAGGSWVDLPEDVAKDYMGVSFNSSGGRRGMARRLAWNEPCLTLTTSPSQKFTDRCHPEETRPFTVREYARIQTFPDNWQFSGGVGSQYKQIGNAVPVKMAEAIGREIVNTLEGITTRESCPEEPKQSSIVCFYERRMPNNIWKFVLSIITGGSRN